MKRALAAGAALFLTLAGCSGNDSGDDGGAARQSVEGNLYRQTNLVADRPEYRAQFTQQDFVNAWGLAIRPSGAGEHFWVGAGGTSYEYVGDVTRSDDPKLQTLFQDPLKEVVVPGADADTTDASIGKITGVIFNGSDIRSDALVVRNQPVQADGAEQLLTGSARFIFATDTGAISAWTELNPAGELVRRDGPAIEMFNGKDQGMAFFGIAIKPGAGDTLLVADFGEEPQIRQFDKNWRLQPTDGFVNPFATGDPIDPADADKGNRIKPGDPGPFNITTLGDRVFVAYATTQALDGNPTAFDAGEEDSLNVEIEKAVDDRPDKGKLAEFDADGNLVRIYQDEGRLNAPWGTALAPDDFGGLSGALLVGNFGGAGRILAFNQDTGEFIDYLRDEDGRPVGIAGLWALLFGNGESLGDSNALYFTAGPSDETEGLFGALRPASR
ncbi:TIGR03118 family protein [Rhodococcus opacus]|uniref:TIGR03118 family protein n=1 Tax=Rhodococcus opacus TaxID=37919 RepID=UPI001C44808F|nr:TIGR03118 family protein [Rhodococcus opacus]MBV6762924.1 TIGR03118 family protein [Rhodococcus opacus]